MLSSLYTWIQQTHRVALIVFLLLTGGLGCQSTAHDNAPDAAIRDARGVMDAFMEAFNRQDVEAWAKTLHFPHVRLARGQVVVTATAVDFIVNTDLQPLVNQGWAFSRWDSIDVIHAGPDKVHFAVTFSRYRANHERLATFNSLYVVERVDGRWGVRSRSSFAP